jgi:hypothetical protein
VAGAQFPGHESGRERSAGAQGDGDLRAGRAQTEGTVLVVLTLKRDRISAITRFVDEGVMGAFGLPVMLD